MTKRGFVAKKRRDTEPTPSKSQAQLWAETEVDRLLSSHPREHVETLRDMLHERLKRPRGRPEGTGEDDSEHLRKMEQLIANGECRDEVQAAATVAGELPIHAQAATRRRLRDKYRKEILGRDSEQETPAADESGLSAERKALLDRIFEEDVEQWDL